jgi:hypothetical protein
MLCQVFVFATHDLDIMAEFPHELSAWAATGEAAAYFKSTGNLTRNAFAGVKQDRSVTTEGLQGPPHGFSHAAPPKYPPHQLAGRRCDHSIIAAVEGHAQIVVYAIDTIDPDDYDSLPAAMKDMRPGDSIKDEVWGKVRDGLVAVTPVGELRDQVATWLDSLREDYPLATATQFAVEVRTWVS